MSWYRDEINLKIVGLGLTGLATIFGIVWGIYIYYDSKPPPEVKPFDPIMSP